MDSYKLEPDSWDAVRVASACDAGGQAIEGGPVEKGRSRAPGARGMSTGWSATTGRTYDGGAAWAGAGGALKTASQEQQLSGQLQPPPFPCDAESPSGAGPGSQQLPQEAPPFASVAAAEHVPEDVTQWSFGADVRVMENTAARRIVAATAKRELWVTRSMGALL